MHPFSLILALTSILSLPVIGIDICGGALKRDIIARNRLYFMGAGYKSASDNNPSNFSNYPNLFWLDLDGTFPVNGYLNETFVSNTSFTSDIVNSGALWTDKNETVLYTVGAKENQQPAQFNVEAYNIQSSFQETIAVSGGSFNVHNRGAGLFASSSKGDRSLSFLSGGGDGIPGMIIFNSSNPHSPSWTNVTDSNIPFFEASTTQYLRFGSAGVLVTVGGFSTQEAEGDESEVQLREMNIVQIYDIATGRWSKILAEGDIPSPRSNSCSSVSAAPDDSSFQMHVYGGRSRGIVFDDIYLLTIPAFRWIKIQGNSTNSSNLNISMGRLNHFCDTYKDRQMLVLMGRNTIDLSKFRCNTKYPMLQLLDTSTFEWQTQYPLANTTYQVPRIVSDIVGGGPNGGAAPARAWQQTLGNNVDLFSKTILRYDPVNPPPQLSTSTASHSLATSVTRPSTFTSSPPRPSNNSSGGTLSSPKTRSIVIVGSVVGPIAGLSIAGSAIFFYLLKRRRHGSENLDHRFGQKPELSSRYSSKPWAKSQNGGKFEVAGNNPEDLEPIELDGNMTRQELNGDATRQELA